MTEKSIKEKSHFRKHLGFYILLLLSIGALGYVWTSSKYEKHKMTKAHKMEISALEIKLDSLMQITVNRNRILIAKTLGQAISNMNNQEKDQYFDQLIKYKGISEVIFENTDKIIVVTTNNKYLNDSAVNSLQFKFNYQNTDTQSFDQNGVNIIAHPVLRGGKIDGTLVIVFPYVSVVNP